MRRRSFKRAVSRRVSAILRRRARRVGRRRMSRGGLVW